MVDCSLTEKQKNLIRSLKPHLDPNQPKSSPDWIVHISGAQISRISGLPKGLWEQAWKGVGLSDFEVFERCGFFHSVDQAESRSESHYVLHAAAIRAAIAADFKPKRPARLLRIVVRLVLLTFVVLAIGWTIGFVANIPPWVKLIGVLMQIVMGTLATIVAIVEGAKIAGWISESHD